MIIGNLDIVDLGLILTDQRIGIPEPKRYEVDIPSGDGKLDLTEFFGWVKYNNRPLEFEFTYPIQEGVLQTVINALHGRRLDIVVDDDPDWVYRGRVTVEEGARISNTVGTLTVECDCDPYKYKPDKTVVERTIGSSGSIQVTLHNDRMPVIPTITTSGEITIQYKGNSYTVSAGTYKLTNLLLEEGESDFTVTGANGTTIKIEYQEGAI